jgi:GNAT superfamily N-acetyltransferase
VIKRIEVSRVERDAFEGIWRILESTIREGAVYALSRDMSFEEARDYWFAPGNHVFVATAENEVVGSYYLRANALGGGAHVANAGFVTAPRFRGQGVARAMGEHCAVQASALGFRAIQFNFVVAANSRAVHLWQSLGYAIVGTLPRAFALPGGELSDVFVMHRFL